MNETYIRVQANAKINLTLDVLGKRKDGYHDIRSIMQSISLSDRITLIRTEGEISIECAHPEVPCNISNLACRAAYELQKAARARFGVHIKLNKGIPVAAGLGGGSTDAAAVLRGLNRLWNTKLDNNELIEIGKRIGADVPFCLLGGTALAEGIGEILTPLKPIPRLWLVLFKPPFGVSTGDVYHAFDRRDHKFQPVTDIFMSRMNDNNMEAMVAATGNMLEETTTALYPEVRELINRLQNKKILRAFMCGSGPTVCAVTADRRAAKLLRMECSDFNGKTYIAYTVPRASVILKR